MSKRTSIACLLLLALPIAAGGVAQQRPADLILAGGTVLSVDERDHRYRAVAVRDGLVLAVGTTREIAALRGAQTEVVELGGRAVAPGFIDAHGHFSGVATVSSWANLAPPPVGRVSSLAELRDALARHAANAAEDEWILGFGYDDSLLAEGRHPQRSLLDQVASDRPVVAIHVSGHLLSCNSRALALAGIDEESEAPAGGVIRRERGSRTPNGVLEETARNLVLAHLPASSLEERLRRLQDAQRTYIRYGLTTAQEGLANALDVDLLLEAAERGLLELDVVAYPTVAALEALADRSLPTDRYRSRLRVGGVKIVLDGSPQGKTAFLSEPYHRPPEGRDAGYRGYPTLRNSEVESLVARFLGERRQILAHANGDAAADQLIAAVAAAGREVPLADHRTVMIHAQTLRVDQLPSVARLGIIPSFFVAHTFYWGDWHRDSVLGPERARVISPTRSALQRGLRFTLHNDAPIVPPDMLFLMWTAVHRRTRSGQVLGPEERIEPLAALRAITLDAAYQLFEEDSKGSIEVGKLADLVILSEDPLAIEPQRLREVRVVATYKEGKLLFERR